MFALISKCRTFGFPGDIILDLSDRLVTRVRLYAWEGWKFVYTEIGRHWSESGPKCSSIWTRNKISMQPE